MKISGSSILLLLSGLVLCKYVNAGIRIAAELPELKIMPGMQLEWVAKKMIYNNNLLSIRNFSVNQKPDVVMNYYASLFKIKGHGVLKSTSFGKEKTIGYEHEGYLFSIQVKGIQNGSIGSIVVSRRLVIEPVTHEFPVRNTNRVITRIQNLDKGRHATTLHVRSRLSVADNRNWYRSTLKKQGWLIYNTASGRSVYEEQYQKGSQYCQIIYTKTETSSGVETLIQIHWVKA